MLTLQKSLLKFITVQLDTFILHCAWSLLLMTWGPHDSQWHIRKPQKADKTGFPKASAAGAQTLPATPKLWQGRRYEPMRRSQRRPPTPRVRSLHLITALYSLWSEKERNILVSSLVSLKWHLHNIFNLYFLLLIVRMYKRDNSNIGRKVRWLEHRP